MNNLKIIFLLLLTLCFFPLSAQENKDENLDDRVTTVEKTVAKLPKIVGDINLRHRYDDVADLNSFDVRRVRLDFRGNLAPAWSYRLHFDFASTPSAAPKILDVFVNWKINDFVSFQAGQYKIPFSLENPYNPNNLEMADNSLVISNLVNYGGVLSSNGRDIGLSFMGGFVKKDGFNLLNYNVGFFNGSGINRVDDNKAKDFSGIFTVKPIKNLDLAVSYYNGGRIGEQDSILKRDRTGFGAKYDDGKLLVRSEYILGNNERVNNSVLENFKSDGAYAVVGYYVIPKVQLLAKYDYLKPNSDSDKGQNFYTAGFNFLPANNVRVQFNYTYRTEPGRDDSSYFITQLWVKF